MDDAQFAADHAPGAMKFSASLIPPLVLPPEHLAGYDPSPLAIAHHLRGTVALPRPAADPLVISLPELGHWAEGLGKDLLRKRGIRVIADQPHFERTAADLGFPLVANPDGLIDTSDGLWGVEYKLVTTGPWEDGPPKRHIAQCQAQMIASRSPAHKSHLVGVLLVPIFLDRGAATEPVEIHPDDEAQDAIMSSCGAMWTMLQSPAALPAPDATESSYRALLATTTLQDSRTPLYGREAMERGSAWSQARLDRLAAEKTEDAARFWFAARAGDADAIELDDGTVISRKAVAGRTETKPSWRWTVKEPRR